MRIGAEIVSSIIEGLRTNPPAPRPEGEPTLSEFMQQVMDEAKLSNRQRQVTELRFGLERPDLPSRPKVAAELGISVSTVRTHELRAIAKMRRNPVNVDRLRAMFS